MSKEIEELEAKYQQLGQTIGVLKRKEAAQKAEQERLEEEARSKTGLSWKPASGEPYYAIRQFIGPGPGGGFMVESYKGHSSNFAVRSKMPFFRTAEQASAFGDAFQVMLELRAQPGIITGSMDIGFSHHTIAYRAPATASDGPVKQVYVDLWSTRCAEVLGPRFKTRVDAERAIGIVGEQRIYNAFKTLMFIDN